MKTRNLEFLLSALSGGLPQLGRWKNFLLSPTLAM